MVIDIPSWLDSYFYWFPTWAQTPGFAGMFAVLAASIALLATRHTARVNRATAEREQWWAKAEYALGLAMEPVGPKQDVGFSLLRSLIARTIIEEDMLLLRSATESFLDPRRDGLETDDKLSPETDNGTYEGGESDGSTK